MKNKGLIVRLAAIIALAIAYYLWEENNSSRVQGKEVVKIGAVLPLTGNISFLGKAAQNGLLFADYYFNEIIDSKYKYEFVFEDGQAKPTNSVSALNKLIDIDNIDICFSTISAVDLACVPLQEKEALLFVSHSSHPGLSGVNSLFFRHSNIVSQEADFIVKHLELSGRVTLISMSDEYGLAFQSYLEGKLSAEFFSSVLYEKGETKFGPIAIKAISNNPDAIVICGAGGNLGNLPIKLRQQGFQGSIYTTLAFKASGADKLTKELSDLNMVSLKTLIAGSGFEQAKNTYENKTGNKLNTFDLIFFNSAFILLSTVNEYGNDYSKVALKIRENSPINAFGGKLFISEQNDILPKIEIITQ